VNQSPVHILEHSCKTFGKGIIAGAAAKASCLFKIDLGEPADRATDSGRILVDFLGGSQSQQQIGKGKSRGIIDPLLFGAGFAEIHLLHLTLDNLG
jgi:hypothetical protein